MSAALLLSFACGRTRHTQVESRVTVYAQPGETVKEAVESLPVGGGTVVLGIGTWNSGYGATEFISTSNITIQGSGIAGYNSAFTAMNGGTIVRGHLSASTGADYFAVRDLGVDAGPDYINTNNGGQATDALSIFNNGQVVGATPVQSVRVENVSCLGYSPTAAAHCMLIENVNDAYIHNVVTVMNCHGLVLKGTNSTVDGVYARGHGIDSIIVKSDSYAPSSHDDLSNVTVTPLIAAGDTKGIIIQGVSAPISKISISNALIQSPLAWGINVQGASATTPATALSFSEIDVEYPGESPTDEYCMQFVQYVSTVNISNLTCANMWAGIAPYQPASGAFNEFTVIGSQFRNIATNGIETYGRWNVFQTTFGSIAGSGIVGDSGVTTVSRLSFSKIGLADMFSAGGIFVTLKNGPHTR